MFQVLMGIGFIQGTAQEFLSNLYQGVELAEITDHTDWTGWVGEGSQHSNQRENAEPKPKVFERQRKIVYKMFELFYIQNRVMWGS